MECPLTTQCCEREQMWISKQGYDDTQQMWISKQENDERVTRNAV